MTRIAIRDVTADNWRATLGLSVYPEQQRFVSDYTPIAAIVLAKAYVRPGDLRWVPYAICADETIVGMIELAYDPESPDRCWIYHFFIDRTYQGRGYGIAALDAFTQLIRALHPLCRQIDLMVHPENLGAQHLYTRAGFQPTGSEQDGEPVYTLRISDLTQDSAEQ